MKVDKYSIYLKQFYELVRLKDIRKQGKQFPERGKEGVKKY